MTPRIEKFLAALPELGPGAQVNGRVDRLAITDTEVLILDFKTNRPPPSREDDVSPIYLAQMALYRFDGYRASASGEERNKEIEHIVFTAPGIDVKPPSSSTGSDFRAMLDSEYCTPSLAPQITPANKATAPEMLQIRIQMVLSGMPTDSAAS